MARALRVAAYILIFASTSIINIYHAGVFPKPTVALDEKAEAVWIDRREAGINQLILKGPPFARGREAGARTAHLLLEQEEQLVHQLRHILPTDLMVQAMVLGAITYFQGIDKYFSRENVQEMYGTSFSAPKSFDYLADGFTRQIAYHGLHEVGQMMVDQGFEDMGCTVAAVPFKNSFVIGRNFDFEGGRIFDSEKIVKWVFPTKGYAYVSVIWAGMVGAVTGVNEKGVYISINAAGSADHRRIGTPSTLVLLDVLENAANTEQAIEILRRAQMFITDLFVILDSEGHLVRVEKSSARMEVIPLHGPSIVTNHLISKSFVNDPTNIFRKNELTSVARADRGEALLRADPPARSPTEAVRQVLQVLRDKGVDENGAPLNLGNRKAIDALIATHSVIYDPMREVFYVGKGPAVVGLFKGYDLKASFTQQRPVVIDGLPQDPTVTPEEFNSLKEANLKISQAHAAIRAKRCAEGKSLLNKIRERWREQSPYYQALGDLEACGGNHPEARAAWSRALALHPAYARMQRQLEKDLNEK